MSRRERTGLADTIAFWLRGPDKQTALARNTFHLNADAARAQRDWLAFTVGRHHGRVLRSPIGLLFVGIGAPALLDAEGRCSVHPGEGRADCWHRQLADDAAELGWDPHYPGDWRFLRPSSRMVRFLHHQSDLEIVVESSVARWRWLPDVRPDAGLRFEVRRTSAGLALWSFSLGRAALLPVQPGRFEHSRGLLAAWLTFARDCGLRLGRPSAAPMRVQQALWAASGLLVPFFVIAGQGGEAIAVWLLAGALTLNRVVGIRQYRDHLDALLGGTLHVEPPSQWTLAEFADSGLRETAERLLTLQRAFHRLVASGARRNPRDLAQLDRIVQNGLSLAARLDQLRSNVVLKRERARLAVQCDEVNGVAEEHRRAFERLDRVAGQVEHALHTAADQLALSYTRLQGINLVEDLALDFNVSLRTLEDQTEFLRALEAASEQLYAVLREDDDLLAGLESDDRPAGST